MDEDFLTGADLDAVFDLLDADILNEDANLNADVDIVVVRAGDTVFKVGGGQNFLNYVGHHGWTTKKILRF